MSIRGREIRKVVFRIPKKYGKPLKPVEKEYRNFYLKSACKVGKGYYESGRGTGGWIDPDTGKEDREPCYELRVDVSKKEYAMDVLKNWGEMLAMTIGVQLKQKSVYFTIDNNQYFVDPKVGITSVRPQLPNVLEPAPELRQFLEEHGIEPHAIDGSIELVPLPVNDEEEGVHGYTRDMVEVQRMQGKFELRPELERIASEELDRRAKSSSLRKHWRAMEIRGNFIDHPELIIRLKEMPYYRFAGLEMYLDRPVLGKKTLRESFGSSIMDLQDSPYGHITTAAISVVTSDDNLILVKRSNEVDRYPGCWSASIEEVMSADSDSVDPWNTVERGVHEELGDFINVEKDRTFLTGIVLEYDCLAVSLTFLTFIDEEWEEIVSEYRGRASAGQAPVPDPREWIVADCVPFTADRLGALLRSENYEASELAFSRLPERGPGKWHPTSKYRVLRASYYRHGIPATWEALGKKKGE